MAERMARVTPIFKGEPMQTMKPEKCFVKDDVKVLMKLPLYKMILFIDGPPDTTFYGTRWPFVPFDINHYLSFRNADRCLVDKYFKQTSRAKYASVHEARIYPFAVMEPLLTLDDISTVIQILNREFQAQVPHKSPMQIYDEMCEKYDGRILKGYGLKKVVDEWQPK